MSDYQGLVTKWQTRLNFLQSLRPEDRLLGDYTEEETLINCIKAVAEVIARNVQPSPDAGQSPTSEPKPRRMMRLPKNPAYPNFNELHFEDVWCVKSRCTYVGDFPPETRPASEARPVQPSPDWTKELLEYSSHWRSCPMSGWQPLTKGAECNCGWAELSKRIAEARPVQQPAQIIAAQQAEDEGLWCIPQTVMEAHLQKELRRLTEAVEGKTSAECLRELLLKSRVQQPATEPGLKALELYYAQKDGCPNGHDPNCGKICLECVALALRDVPQGQTNEDLIAWLENESEKLMGQVISRRGTAETMRNATVGELRDAHRLAEKMSGRKLHGVDDSVESAKAGADMDDRIANKLERQARQLSAWADRLRLAARQVPVGPEGKK